MSSIGCKNIVISVIRINLEEALNVAQQVFGVSFGIGIRKAPPRKGEATVHLLDEDVIDIVQFNEELNQPENAGRSCRSWLLVSPIHML